MPSLAIDSATRTFTRWSRRPAAARSPRARWPPAAPHRRPPGSTGRPLRSDTISSVLRSSEDLLERHRAEVAEPEDLAGQLALPAGQHEAAPLELAVERLPVEAVGHGRRGHGPRGVARVGEQLEAERGQASPGRRGARLVAREDPLGPLLAHEAQALVDLVDDRDRRRERRLPVAARHGGPAGRGRSAASSPSPSPPSRAGRRRSSTARAPTSTPSANR